ncbi:HAMP domain-containing histidine kinase [Deinococcus taeanensis]|uniref:sensor histidine kinase n=1 Tax=Deinococcus taeanensis TaxID=2737050 RepID=UPI001CDC091D|nr:HAMP domain-containing sensor histidine kinase [Deinococcus taeanensis]UBV41996.1 HAMP domain-containing histidine kinase [Deinococcus taeanensis]
MPHRHGSHTPLWDLSRQSRSNVLTALLPMLLSGTLIVLAFLPAHRTLSRPGSAWDTRAYQELVADLAQYAQLQASVPGSAPARVQARKRLLARLQGSPERLALEFAQLGEQEQEAGVHLRDIAPLLRRDTLQGTSEALGIAAHLNTVANKRLNKLRATLQERLAFMESTMLLAGLLTGLLGSTLILRALSQAGYERHTREQHETQQREALGMAAHELRRPMQALLLATDALRHTDNLRAREKLLRSIEDHAAQLAARTELERLDAMYVRVTSVPAPTDLSALVARAESLRVRVRRPPHPLLWTVDTCQIQQVLENLVENALKYSDGPVTVTLDPPTAARGPVVRVTDSGPGLHPSLYEQAFQVGTRHHAGNGEGLGLPLARRLARANHAEITLHDAPGGGLDVRLTFQAQPARHSGT